MKILYKDSIRDSDYIIESAQFFDNKQSIHIAYHKHGILDTKTITLTVETAEKIGLIDWNALEQLL